MSNKNETAIVDIIVRGQAGTLSMKDMEKAAARLRAELKRLPTESEAFIQKTKDLQTVNKRLKSIKDDVSGLGGVFGNLGNDIKKFSILTAGYMSFNALTSGISGLITKNAELSDSLADIRKTTGMTKSEVERLNSAFSQINTRTTEKELRAIAVGAGQLGIAKNDVLKFTIAVDKMNVALGDEFTGGAEEVTKVTGGLRNIFSDIKSDKIDEDMLHIGNAINELGSAGSATGPVIADFSNRIGGVGIQMGLTSGEVLGLSATLQELNVSTERGGTAVVKILQKMVNNVGDFAKVAGVPTKDFAELVNRDLFGAFVKVAEGAKKGGDSAIKLGKILDDLGVEGAGASEVFAKVGSNTDLLRQKVDLATTSLKNTDSILSEFQTKNATLAGETERLGKAFSRTFINSGVEGVLKAIVGGIADLVDTTQKASEGMQEEMNTVNALVAELGDANTTQARRVEIYEQLKGINPEIVNGIDKESISMQKLTDNVQRYNMEAINRITIQKKQEELDDANERAAGKLSRAVEQRSKSYQDFARVLRLNNELGQKARQLNTDTSLSIQQKISQLLSQFPKAANQFDLGALSKAEYDYNQATKESSKILEQKNELIKELGINTAQTAKIETDYTKMTLEQLKRRAEGSTMDLEGRHDEKAIEEIARREKAKKDIILSVDEATQKKLQKEHEKLYEQLGEIEEKYKNHFLSDQAVEEKAIIKKYSELIKKVKDGSAEEMLLRESMALELQGVEKKYSDKALKAKEEYLRKRQDAEQSAEQNEIDQTIEFFDKLIEEAKKYGDNYASLESAKWNKVDEIRQRYLKKEENESEKKPGKHKKQNQFLAGNNQTATQYELDQAVGVYGEFYNRIGKIADDWEKRQEQQTQQQLADLDYSYTYKEAHEKRLLDAKVLNQQQYDQKIAKLENEKQERAKQIHQEDAARQRKIALFKATTEGAASIVKTLAEYAYPYNLLFAGLDAVAVGGEISVIENEPMPAFAGGGYHTGTPQGYVDQPTVFTGSATGQPFLAGEAGKEYIVPSWMLRNPVVANTIGMFEAMRMRGYASGGYTSNKSTTKPTESSTPQDTVATIPPEFINEIRRLNDLLDGGIYAKFSYDTYIKDLNRINGARDSAAVK